MSDDVTEHLRRFGEGDRQALDEIVPAVYDELRSIASRSLRKERREHTLQTSALVHEAYLKLIDQDRVQYSGRAHFFAIAAQVMRRLLVDYARERYSAKRGGGARLRPFDEGLRIGAEESDPRVLVLDAALTDLARLDPELAVVIELRFFGGLDNEEIAIAEGVSVRTVIRRWRTAQAWLLRYLAAEGEPR